MTAKPKPCTQSADRARIQPVLRALRTITTGRLARVCCLSHERTCAAVAGWDAVSVKRAHGDTVITWRQA